MHTVHEISVAALHELQTHSDIFIQFEESIFGRQAIEFDRDVADINVVTQIDKEISRFIKLLAGFFQFKCSITCLEFLVRRFRVDLFHANDMFFAFLPYHDLEHFGVLTKQVQIPALEGYEVSFPISRQEMF